MSYKVQYTWKEGYDILNDQELWDLYLFKINNTISVGWYTFLSELKSTGKYECNDITITYLEHRANVKTKDSCSHSRKYVNNAGFTKFWVCPDCKKDLGNA